MKEITEQFALDTLQEHMYDTHKMKIEETLMLAEALRDKGLITEPRTELGRLPKDKNIKINNIYKAVALNIDNKKYPFDLFKSDHSFNIHVDNEYEHSAILPTHKISDLKRLSERENLVYTEIINRFLLGLIEPQISQ